MPKIFPPGTCPVDPTDDLERHLSAAPRVPLFTEREVGGDRPGVVEMLESEDYSILDAARAAVATGEAGDIRTLFRETDYPPPRDLVKQADLEPDQVNLMAIDFSPSDLSSDPLHNSLRALYNLTLTRPASVRPLLPDVFAQDLSMSFSTPEVFTDYVDLLDVYSEASPADLALYTSELVDIVETYVDGSGLHGSMQRSSAHTVMRVLARTGDESARPVLAELTEHDTAETRAEAREALDLLDHQQSLGVDGSRRETPVPVPVEILGHVPSYIRPFPNAKLGVRVPGRRSVVLEWFVAPDDAVAQGEVVAEVAYERGPEKHALHSPVDGTADRLVADAESPIPENRIFAMFDYARPD
jgi:hypothetical protein